MFPSHNVTTARPSLLAATEQHPLLHTHPFYYSPSPSLLPALSDSLLTVIAPVPAYWLTAAFFQILDLSNAPWLIRHRIHDSAEVASRNRASRLQVFNAVVLQQVIQTALAIVWVSEHPEPVDHAAAMRSIARALALSPLGAFDSAAVMVAPLAYLLYWWFIPAVRLLIAMYVTCLSPRGTHSTNNKFFFFFFFFFFTQSTIGSTFPTLSARSTTTQSKASYSTPSELYSPSPSRASQSVKRCSSLSFPPARLLTTTAGTAFRLTHSRCSAVTRPTTTIYTIRPSASSRTFPSPGSSIGTSSLVPA